MRRTLEILEVIPESTGERKTRWLRSMGLMMSSMEKL